MIAMGLGQIILLWQYDEMFETFPELYLIKQNDQKTLEKLNSGEINDLRVSFDMPVDDIVRFGLDQGFLKKGLCSFPDPRKDYDIPIDIMLLPSVIQRLNDEHSLVSAPYMLNSADLLSRLGYSPVILESGFNDKNIYPRTKIFDGESLKHLLLQVKPSALLKWFNKDWNQLVKDNAPGRTKNYLMDGTKLLIPAHLFEKYEGAGMVRDEDGNYSYGYKIVWIQEVIDRKLVIRSMAIVAINVHDLEAGKKLVEEFDFEEGSTLIMDRGFFDLDWITELKEKRHIDISIPLKSNAEVIGYAWIENKTGWAAHPTRENQWVKALSEKDLSWDEYAIFKSGVVVKYCDKRGEEKYIYFVSTKKGQSAKQILATYDLRSEIEECHRQMKCFQGLEKLPSKKLTQVFFRVIMGTIAYNLFNLFLNSEECNTLEDFTLKKCRQQRREERNPKVIIYADDVFGIMKLMDILQIILGLGREIREKLSKLFKNIALQT